MWEKKIKKKEEEEDGRRWKNIVYIEWEVQFFTKIISNNSRTCNLFNLFFKSRWNFLSRISFFYLKRENIEFFLTMKNNVNWSIWKNNRKHVCNIFLINFNICRTFWISDYSPWIIEWIQLNIFQESLHNLFELNKRMNERLNEWMWARASHV